MTYCPNCGSTSHPVGACPSLTNPDFARQQAERIHAASQAAANDAPTGGVAPGNCLLVLLLWGLVAGAVVLALVGAGWQ